MNTPGHVSAGDGQGENEHKCGGRGEKKGCPVKIRCREGRNLSEKEERRQIVSRFEEYSSSCDI